MIAHNGMNCILADFLRPDLGLQSSGCEQMPDEAKMGRLMERQFREYKIGTT